MDTPDPITRTLALAQYGSLRGRISRKPFTLWFVLPYIIIGAVHARFGYLLIGFGLGVWRASFWIAFVVTSWLAFVGLAKRFQDLGVPGIPLAAIWVVIRVVVVSGLLFVEGGLVQIVSTALVMLVLFCSRRLR